MFELTHNLSYHRIDFNTERVIFSMVTPFFYFPKTNTLYHIRIIPLKMILNQTFVVYYLKSKYYFPELLKLKLLLIAYQYYFTGLSLK